MVFHSYTKTNWSIEKFILRNIRRNYAVTILISLSAFSSAFLILYSALPLRDLMTASLF